MIAFYYLCDYINAAVRAWLALQLVDGIFEPRRTGKQLHVVRILIIAFTAFHQPANSYFSHSVFSNNILILMMLLVIAGSLWLYECSFLYAICLNILNWVGIALADLFIQICAWMVLGKFGIRQDVFITVSVYRGCYLLISAFVLVLIGMRMKRWFAERKQEVFRVWKRGIVLTFLLLPCMIYFQRVYLRMGSEELFGRFWIFFISTVLIFFLFGFNVLRQKMEEEKRVHRLEIQMLEQGYEEMLKGYREKSILMHDVKNHLRTIHIMLEERPKEECESYVVQLTGEIHKEWNTVWTNCNVLDLVLNMKFQEAKKAQIEVLCHSDSLSGLKLDSIEICALFGNLLDNAIEANERCPEGMERKIEVRCKRQKSMLVVTVSNPVENGMGNPKEMFLGTTKRDKTFHGFGMFSMERVLRNHSGYWKADVQENWLKVLVYLDGFED